MRYILIVFVSLIFLFVFDTKGIGSAIKLIIKDKYSQTQNSYQPSVVINNFRVQIEIVKTQTDQAKGLSGRNAIDEDKGMLFLYESPVIPYFWMKGMLMPIDIIWINNKTVVGCEKNVPFYPLNTPDSQLPTYHPSGSINFVLEVQAGFCEKHGVEKGTEAVISF